MDPAAAHALTGCCAAAPPDPAGGVVLCPTWLRWVLAEAHARGVALTAAVLEQAAWTPCAAADLVLLDPDALRVTARPGCGGRVTRLLLVQRGVVVGAAFARRAPRAAEPVGWGGLLAEAVAREELAAARWPG